MYKAKINQSHELNIDSQIIKEWDTIEVKKNSFHILKDNQSFNAEIVEADLENKIITVKVNENQYTIELKDKMDLLLEEMGMSNQANKKINDIKAPMPGLILDIKVNVGDTVQKGDGILVLEAMKMENILKSPGDGVIKSIEIKQGDAIEKNQVLIRLD